MRLVAIAFTLTMAMAQDKGIVIAVKTFENPANDSQSTIGNALTDILITELKSTGKFRLLERANVDELMKEMQFGSSEFAKSPTFAQKGQLLGAQYILMGKVANISFAERFEDKQQINLFGPNTVKRIYQQQADARVDFKIVDVATGEAIISQAGEAHKTNTSETSENPTWLGWSRYGRVTGEFNSSLFGRATIEAVKDVVRKLNALSTSINDVSSKALLTKEFELLGQAQGPILGEAGGGLWIVGIGSASGLHKGDRLKVTHDNVVQDQAGKEIYRRPVEIGSMEVTDVSQPNAAEARFTPIATGGASATPKANDLVRIDVDYARALRAGGTSTAPPPAPTPAGGNLPSVTSAATPDARLEPLLKRAESYARDKLWPQALEAYNSAATLNPGDPRVLDGQTGAHYMMKDFVEGDESAEKLLQTGAPLTVPVAHYHAMGLCSGQLTIQKGKLAYKGPKDGFDVSAADLLGAQVHLLSKPTIANEKAPNWMVLEVRVRNGKHEEKFQLLTWVYSTHPDPEGKNWSSHYALEGNEAADAQKLEESLANLIQKYVR